MRKGIRWTQRFDNYKRVLAQLQEAERLYRERPLSHIEQQGLIQALMIQARNLTSHAYDQKMAEQVITEIVEKFFPQFMRVESTMSAIESEDA